MNVPITWLQEYIDVPLDAQLLADKFTYIGHMLDRPPQQIGKEIVLDLEVRQNRSDCLALVGLARELGAVMNKPIKIPKGYDINNIKSGGLTITIEDPNLCYRFNTLTITGIQNKQSPDWMRHRLETYGIKSINILVDITNYVMVETGQPLHAFEHE